jgi:hypothetical protein
MERLENSSYYTIQLDESTAVANLANLYIRVFVRVQFNKICYSADLLKNA